MREILFRAKGKLTNGWIYNDLFHYDKQDFVTADNRVTAIYPETVGQFTGLTDANGKKIFEGDFINLEGLGNAVVRFGKYIDCDSDFNNDYAVGFYLEMGNIKCNILTDVEMMSGCEIIGNIHDNPELLEAQK